MKRKYLKVSVGADLHALLCRAASHRGLSLAAFVRLQLEERQKPFTLEAQLSRIESQVLRAAQKASTEGADRMLLEVLLLVRELAAERNAQLLRSVRQKLDAMRGGERV